MTRTVLITGATSGFGAAAGPWSNGSVKSLIDAGSAARRRAQIFRS